MLGRFAITLTLNILDNINTMKTYVTMLVHIGMIICDSIVHGMKVLKQKNCIVVFRATVKLLHTWILFAPVVINTLY